MKRRGFLAMLAGVLVVPSTLFGYNVITNKKPETNQEEYYDSVIDIIKEVGKDKDGVYIIKGRSYFKKGGLMRVYDTKEYVAGWPV